ncbi:MAG: hypothetical protein EOO43_11115 [Flavobacterium sp.]|nr:MAG: hypothetical protein EOO43_11115 [Flavobacterium sp.]
MKTSEIINRINQQKNGQPIIEPNGTEHHFVSTAIQLDASNPQPEKTIVMITKVTAKPNPFFTSITLDVVCEQSKHTIVRMFDMDNRIVKMFSWYLVKGTNVTTINELNSLGGGTYFVDIIDSEAKVLYATRLRKEVA